MEKELNKITEKLINALDLIKGQKQFDKKTVIKTALKEYANKYEELLRNIILKKDKAMTTQDLFFVLTEIEIARKTIEL